MYSIVLFHVLLLLNWQTPELGITEHIAEDACKFAVWTGKPPQSEDKRIIKVKLRCHFCTVSGALFVEAETCSGNRSWFLEATFLKHLKKACFSP